MFFPGLFMDISSCKSESRGTEITQLAEITGSEQQLQNFGHIYFFVVTG
jgi:hypothetical protein